MSEELLKRLGNKVVLLTDYYIEGQDIYVSDITGDEGELFTEKEAKILLCLLGEISEDDCISKEELDYLFTECMDEVENIVEDL